MKTKIKTLNNTKILTKNKFNIIKQRNNVI